MWEFLLLLKRIAIGIGKCFAFPFEWAAKKFGNDDTWFEAACSQLEWRENKGDFFRHPLFIAIATVVVGALLTWLLKA